MRKIFLSFSVLLSDIELGVITLNDLEDDSEPPLFYFSCARELVINFKEHLDDIFFRSSIDEITIILSRIRDILLVAEKEGRVEWRHLYGKASFEQLNLLLERNGYAIINIAEIPRSWKNYTAKRAAIRIKKEGIRLNTMDIEKP